MRLRRRKSFVSKLVTSLTVLFGAVVLTIAFFFVLPLIQAISVPPETDTVLLAADTANVPPPPPPPEEEPEQEPEQEEQPPELAEETQPLDLSQLELALNPSFGDGWVGGDFALALNTMSSDGAGADELFSLSELDQPPRAVYQPSPALSKKLLKRGPGKVWLIFIVNERGRVENAKVQNSSDPLFEGPALAALKKWRFEPGETQRPTGQLPHPRTDLLSGRKLRHENQDPFVRARDDLARHVGRLQELRGAGAYAGAHRSGRDDIATSEDHPESRFRQCP